MSVKIRLEKKEMWGGGLKHSKVKRAYCKVMMRGHKDGQSEATCYVLFIG